jgi:hypothetical protein
MKEGFDTRRSVGIAVLVALAALTKLSGLVLIPVIALGALWIAQRDKDWRGLLNLGVAMLVAWGALAGWWYLRNLNLYGELLGTQMMATVAGLREDPFTPGTALAEFQGFRLSYWGVFGAFNIQTTGLFYALADFTVFVSMFGVLFLVAQLLAVRDFSFARRELTLLLFLLGIVLVGFIAFLNWTRLTYATQGRLMFPFVAAISPLMAVGFVEIVWWILFLLSPPDRSFVRAGEAVPEPVLNQSLRWPLRFLGIIALLIPLTTIAPHYAPPKPLDELPDTAVRIDADYGDIHLVGYESSDRRYFPGEQVRLTFYWQVEAQSDKDLSLGLTLVSPFGDRLGGIDTFPGAGSLRTSSWEAGKIYPDTYEIQLSRAITARYPFGVLVNWYDESPEDILPATTTEGDEIENVVLGVGAVVTPNFPLNLSRFIPVERLRVDEEGQTVIEQVDRDFQGEILITGFDVDPRTFTLDLEWEAKQGLDEDYTAFVHVMNSEGELVGQADVFPTLPTHYWRFGEIHITSHHIQFFEEDLPPGIYTILTGWYINDGESYPRLLIQPGIEGEERDWFELMSFERREDGLYLWPVFRTDEGDTDDSVVEGAPEPDGFEIIDPNATQELEDIIPEEFLPDAGTDDPDDKLVTATVEAETTEFATEEAPEE